MFKPVKPHFHVPKEFRHGLYAPLEEKLEKTMGPVKVPKRVRKGF